MSIDDVAPVLIAAGGVAVFGSIAVVVFAFVAAWREDSRVRHEMQQRLSPLQARVSREGYVVRFEQHRLRGHKSGINVRGRG